MLKIVTSPDPILATVCEPCTPGDRELVRLSKQMAHLMYKSDGCGIAAPQVGITKRLVVIDVDYDPADKSTQDPLVLVNPEIMELKGEPETAGEGCLSCPGVNVPITRQPWARVRYYDLDGELWEIEGDGLLGRCLQHEIDHLNGRTLFESCDAATRIEALRAYDEAKAKGARPGDTSIEVGAACA
ncbi:MAG: peptide deformylase [Eggerthellaceae bacterium]|nr:peptide deformylase [Eggerthellaceae bacterium]